MRIMNLTNIFDSSSRRKEYNIIAIAGIDIVIWQKIIAADGSRR